MNIKIEKLLKKMTATFLHKGLQPSDMAVTVLNQEYIDLIISKRDGAPVMTLRFEDKDDDEFGNTYSTIITMRYTYSKDMYLQRIEEMVGSRRQYSTVWDRNQDMMGMMQELKNLIGNRNFSPSNFKLPEALCQSIMASIAA